MNLEASLEQYQPFDAQEIVQIEAFSFFYKSFLHKAYTRDNPIAHISSSAWVVNQTHDKVLMCFHNLMNCWAWLGGHADGETDLAHVALKETTEESGLTRLNLLEQTPIDYNVCTVGRHIKKGKFVAPHLHYNVVYLIEGDETEPLVVKPDENQGLQWVPFDQVAQMSGYEYLYERMVQKMYARGWGSAA